LDDVSLESWSTPIVQNVFPAALDDWLSQTITVTGDNFIATPAIYVDDIQLENVQFQDEHTLTGTLPAGLTPGFHDIHVINPGGQPGILPDSLRLGIPIFIPVIKK
jgi:hypothetical protein